MVDCNQWTGPLDWTAESFPNSFRDNSNIDHISVAFVFGIHVAARLLTSPPDGARL